MNKIIGAFAVGAVSGVITNFGIGITKGYWLLPDTGIMGSLVPGLVFGVIIFLWFYHSKGMNPEKYMSGQVLAAVLVAIIAFNASFWAAFLIVTMDNELSQF